MTRETARVASIVATSVWLVAVVWGVAFAMLLWLASREATQRFDDDLASLARTVLAFAEPDLEKTKEQSGLIDRTDARVADRHLYQVWKSDGTLAFQSKGAPSGALTTGTEGFAETEINGIALRTYTTWNATHTFQVQMGVGLRERAWSMLGRPGVFSVFVLAALLMVIHRRPGARYAAQPPASAEAVGDPVNGMLTFAGPRQAPASTVQASSSLVAGPHTARQREHAVMSDTAHALRTPLASLRLLMRQARDASDPAGRREALDLMDGVLRRSTRLIDDMLLTARLEHDAEARDRSLSDRVDLVAIAKGAVRECQRTVSQATVLLQTCDHRSIPMVRGHAGLIEIAIRNLLENAISFAAPDGNVLVEVECEDNGQCVAVRVHDSGPGVSRAFRIGRDPEPDMRPVNAGLGVPLVARIVGLHGGVAYMGVSPRLSGALAVVRLPVPTKLDPHSNAM